MARVARQRKPPAEAEPLCRSQSQLRGETEVSPDSRGLEGPSSADGERTPNTVRRSCSKADGFSPPPRRSCAARFSRSPDGTVFPGLAGRHGPSAHHWPARREALTVTSGRYHEAGNRAQIRVWDSDVVGKTPQQIAADEHVARPMIARIINRCLTHPAGFRSARAASQPPDAAGRGRTLPGSRKDWPCAPSRADSGRPGRRHMDWDPELRRDAERRPQLVTSGQETCDTCQLHGPSGRA